MNIKRIRVTNFKSFEKLEVDLGKFNVLIGANASGKSNFVRIFEFLRDIENVGLNNAVSMQGGVEYLRNINIGASENFSLKVVSDRGLRLPGKRTKEGFIRIKTYETIYEFALKFKGKQKGGLGFEIAQDKLTQKCEFVRVKRHKEEEEKEKIGSGEISISCTKGKVKIELPKLEGVSIKEDDIFPPFLREVKLPPNTLLLETHFFFLFLLSKAFSDISIYDFDPKLPKKLLPSLEKLN
jgi:Predicted ATPase